MNLFWSVAFYELGNLVNALSQPCLQHNILTQQSINYEVGNHRLSINP